MKSFCLLPPILLVFIVSIHQIAGNGIRVPLSKYEPGDEVNGQGFYGTISIGTPPQKINVLFDWKTNGIWMLSSYCNDSVCRAQNHSTYNHKISTTFRGEDDFDTKIWQHPGEATDTITIGNIQTQNVSFFVTTSSEEFNSTPYDGFVGLGRESDFIHRHCEKLGFKRKFSLYIQDNSTSELMLCGEDKTKFQGNLKYITTDGQQFSRWNVAIQSILLHRGDQYVLEMQFDDARRFALDPTSSARRFALDPTSSYITGPYDVIAKIYNELNTRTSKIRDDLKEVDCKHIHTLPNITFRAADNNFTLTGNDYIKQVTHNDQRVCIVQLISHKYSELWIIGNVFNRKFYTVFDVEMQRIGFAERIHDGSA